MHHLRQQWGRNVEQFRLARKLTQEQLAQLCDVNRSTISRVEAGEIAVSDETKYSIARALTLPVAVIFPYLDQPAGAKR